MVLSTLSVGCGATRDPEPPSVDRTVSVPVAFEVAKANPGNRLHWRFTDGTGRVGEGTVDDPRIVRSEFDEVGRPDPVWAVDATIALELRLPNLGGQLVIEDEAGHALTTTLGRESGSASQRRRDALAGTADLLGPPVEVAARTANGPTILILPEGFREAEQADFNALAASLASHIRTHESLGALGSRVRVLRQNVRSQASGTDPAPGTDSVNTAFDSTLGFAGTPRCLFLRDTGRSLAENLRQAAGADVVLVIANVTEWAGCANTGVAVFATSPTLTAEARHLRNQMAFHELGHALFGLGDEYSTNDGQSCGYSSWPNVGSFASWWGKPFVLLPWASQVPAGTPVPTARSVGSNDSYPQFAPRTVGGFEGAGYCVQGRFRPSPVCGMREVHHRLCPVCERHLTSVFASRFPVQPPLPSCDSACTWGVCGRCDAGGWETNCSAWNGCGGMYEIP